MQEITATPDMTVEQIAQIVSGATDYDVDPDSKMAERLHNEAVAHEGVLVFDAWFAREEVDGIIFMQVTDVGEETDDALRVKGRNLEEAHENDPYFQSTFSGWVPKSTVQIQVN